MIQTTNQPNNQPTKNENHMLSFLLISLIYYLTQLPRTGKEEAAFSSPSRLTQSPVSPSKPLLYETNIFFNIREGFQ